LHFGLGGRGKAELIEIRWPSGLVETLKNIEADQVLTVKEGAGLISHFYPRWTSKRK
jgi:hypothetical protein